MPAKKLLASLVTGATAAALLTISGGINWYLSYVRPTVHAQLIDFLFPATFAPIKNLGGFGFVVGSVSAVFIATLVAAMTFGRLRDTTERRSATFLIVWFSVVIAATATALLQTIGVDIFTATQNSPAFLIQLSSDDVVASAYPGLVLGWIPALVAVAFSRPSPAVEVAGAGQAPTRRAIGASIAVLAAAVIGLSSVGWSMNYARVHPGPATTQEAGGSQPPPTASRLPLPTPTPPAPSMLPADPPDPVRCAGNQVNLTIGGVQAALGHRGVAVIMTNTSSSSCDANGYPSLSFVDGTGTALSVGLQPGNSYLYDDPGPQAIPLSPGSSATAYLSWGAGNTGPAAASTVLVAGSPGAPAARIQASLDINDGATVTVTAWQEPKATGN